MHIKQISIHGFKSYRDHTVVENLHKGHNVVVGKNGSGKSNFFLAIEMLFNEEYANLSKKQREALFHDDNGKTTNATIEITFDNADGTLAGGAEEVKIRRIITPSKNQFFINDKGVPRIEIVNLFDRPETTSSSPYFIVKQGSIQRIATAPDNQRLKLLIDVSGTSFFNENNASWRKEIAKSSSAHKELKRFANEIEQRFRMVEEQKSNYVNYQKLDVERRCLQYAIFNRELMNNKRELKTLSLKINEEGPEMENFVKQLGKIQKNLESLTLEFNKIKNEFDDTQEKKEKCIEEKRKLEKQKLALELEINDLTEEITTRNSKGEKVEKDLELLKKEMIEVDEKLKRKEKDYLAAKQEDEKLNLELIKREQNKKELYEKQGRQAGRCFSSVEDRNRWITQKLEQLNDQIATGKAKKENLSDELALHRPEEDALRSKLEKRIAEEKKIRESIEKNDKLFHEHSREINTKRYECKELFREENECRKKLNDLEKKLIESDKEMRKFIGASCMIAMKNVEKVHCKNSELFRGFHGLVVENIISVAPGCEKAISVTAGNRLFNYIVEKEDHGVAILQEMRNQSLPGDVTFLPLKHIQAKPEEQPLDHEDYRSLISLIEYEPVYSNIMNLIFGGTYLARNDEAALKLSGKKNCVTLEGTQVFRDETIVGGYSGTKSQLELFNINTEISSNRESTQAELERISENIKEVNVELNNSISSQQSANIENEKNKIQLNKLRDEILLLKEKLIPMEKFRNEKEKIISELESSLERLSCTKSHLEKEWNQDFSSQPLSQDEHELDELEAEIILLQEKKEITAKTCNDYERSKMKLDGLKKRESDLRKLLDENSTVKQVNQIKTWENERNNVNSALERLSEDLEHLDTKIEELLIEKMRKSKNMKQFEAQEEKINKKLNKIEETTHEWVIEKRHLQENIDACQKKIGDVGALPNYESYSKFDDLSTVQMFDKMTEININLEELGGINRNALKNYIDFENKKKKINQQIELAVERNKSSLKAINSLEEEKTVEIKKTLTGVDNYFKQIFEKIVPNGSAELVHIESQEELEDDNDVPDELTGIGIRVSFNRGNLQMRDLVQFSGGQKSIVALAFILAIQKYKPAPFYLFDEVDQALDVERRNAVGEIIRDLSNNAQFISITFRGELLRYADKCYGVHCQNKVSHIIPVSKQSALDFVEKAKN